jgi:hypothetical protein
MKLSIQPLLPIGNYLNKRYGMEQDFPDDSNPADNFKYLNDVVTAIHMAEFPMFYKDGKALFLPMANSEPVYKGEENEKQVDKIPLSEEIQNALFDIQCCKTQDELDGFWMMSKGNLTLKDAYKAKEKQFKDAK